MKDETFQTMRELDFFILGLKDARQIINEEIDLLIQRYDSARPFLDLEK
jgi:tRNA splicing ligase